MKTYATVHAVALNNKNQYLIMQRAQSRTNPGKWNFITGHIQERESAENAALRELKEETNLTGKIIATTEPYWRDEGDKRWIMVASLIKIDNEDEIKMDPKEASSYRWINAEDNVNDALPGMKLAFDKLGII